jgi:hypothetical protein
MEIQPSGDTMLLAAGLNLNRDVNLRDDAVDKSFGRARHSVRAAACKPTRSAGQELLTLTELAH